MLVLRIHPDGQHKSLRWLDPFLKVGLRNSQTESFVATIVVIGVFKPADLVTINEYLMALPITPCFDVLRFKDQYDR